MLSLDGPALGAGWHRAGTAERGRWTDGDAELSLPRGAAVLEVGVAR